MSRFVSGGTIEGTDAGLAAAPGAEPAAAVDPAKSAEWAAVQRELDAERARREEARRAAAGGHGPDGDKSLYEVLQANKGLSSFYFLGCPTAFFCLLHTCHLPREQRA